MDVAFTIVVHKDIKQIARLLRMIHRKNNYYCIHTDSRSRLSFENALEGLATCFGSNVELVPKYKRVAVFWGDETVLRPQFICAEQALRRHSSWKYLLNIVGQEFPLKTNMEIVAALKALNGSNMIEARDLGYLRIRTLGKRLPNNVTWVKGSIYGAFRREFLQEIIFSQSTRTIRDFMLQTQTFLNPDEFFFSTLNFNPSLHLPGSCMNTTYFKDPLLAKFVIWESSSIPCPTKYVRMVCILGTPHLNHLQRTPELFANKFYSDYHPEAYDIMEKWYFDKVAKEAITGTYDVEHFDVSAYANLVCSRHHY
ncbi:unnamed protein product [Rodentolepis nana]|uniref:Protein xylosyltransferase n=1 Tax=Rodentolepis nana TaxID=102285 RepID=A0A0R3TKE8_RODNA|nr:unnamed protein product [Rodentolepis nana]